MASKYTFDVVATTGEYTNGAGEKKKQYTNVGKAFTNESGQISIKLTAIPVGPEWSGWVSLYEPKPRDDNRSPNQNGARPPLREAQGARSPEYGKAEGKAPVDYFQEDDDIPF